jgi:hypothetical protein
MMIVWKTADDNIPHVKDVVMVTREGSLELSSRSAARATDRLTESYYGFELHTRKITLREARCHQQRQEALSA